MRHSIHAAVFFAAILFPLPVVGQVIDFETLPDSSPTSAGQVITDQYEATFGVSFSTVAATTGAPIGGPIIARRQTSSPFGFAGCGGQTNVPAPGQGIGEAFLTIGSASETLVVAYSTPVRRASGVLIDIDARTTGEFEEWTVRARDASGSVVASTVLTAPMGPNPPGCSSGTNLGIGPGHATAMAWDLRSAGDAIAAIAFEYTGTASSVGIAFDNFSPTGAFPGSQEDALLSTLVNDLGDPRNPIKSAEAGDILSIELDSPLGTFVGSTPIVLAQLLITGSPMGPTPGFPILQVDFSVPGAGAPFVLFGVSTLSPLPLLLPSSGIRFGVGIPPGLTGLSILLQGVLISPNAANGVLATTDAHEVRLL